MFHIKNIDHAIARIVTGIAMTFPVAYIQSISFFKGQKMVAICSWNAGSHKPEFQYFENGFITFTSSTELQSILVNAVDMEGNELNLTSPIAAVQYSIQ
ncbi:MAG: hypothetical protein KBF42_08245 [Chitinophagales bacterium]|jgi:hypothetical protein|nr:hypothetical protein [Bacteroidota bacterium]MBK7567094.1 hypothetical protein [Bacteroidota bacterium]MBP8917236.1 hypothetical protein [Chitinophagales bacterium]MBP9221360.1 hypothetical protein [Chitinophagales bacterium]MBP9795210.1 hypothetical protein [Chitinophagales bacterium]